MVKRRKIFMIMALIASTAAPMGARAQGQNDFSFRASLASARSVALGDAFVADTRDASSAIWNPAGLAFVESLSLTALGGLRLDDRMARTSAALPVAATSFHTLALGAETAVWGQTDWTKHTGTMTGAQAAYALCALEDFSIGVIYNYRMADFGGTHLTSHTGGVGLMYVMLPSLTYGMSVTGVGSGLVIKRADDGTYALTKESTIPKSVTFGATWRYPATHDRPLVEMFLSNESISGESKLVYRLGAEILPWKFLSLRGGIVSGPVTAVGRAGIGIHLGKFDIDYAVASSVAAERMQYLTVSIPLQGQ